MIQAISMVNIILKMEYFYQSLRILEQLLILIRVTAWKSKRLSDESIKPTLTSDKSLNPVIGYSANVWYNIWVKFDTDCLK